MTEPNRATLPHSPGANRGRVAKFLRLVMIEHSVFALPFAYISALTAMWQLTRSVHWWELLLITIAMVSARGRSPWPPTGSSTGASTRRTRAPHNANWSPASSICVPPGSARSSHLIVFLASAAALSSLLPAARAARRGAAGGLPVRQAVHRLSARDPGHGPVDRAGRAPGWRSPARCRGPAGGARPRGGHVDRRIRPHLRLPGRGGRPARSVRGRPGPIRRPGRAAGVDGRARRDVRRVRLVRRRRSGSNGCGGSACCSPPACLRLRASRSCGQTTCRRVNRAFFTANGFIGIGLFVFALADLIAQGLRW